MKILPSPLKLESDFFVVFFSLLLRRQAKKIMAEIKTHIHIIARHPNLFIMIPPRVGPKITAALDISI